MRATGRGFFFLGGFLIGGVFTYLSSTILIFTKYAYQMTRSDLTGLFLAVQNRNTISGEGLSLDGERGCGKVLCWILTGKQFHDSRCQHVKATWSRRCDKVLFMSSAEDPSLPSINLNIKEGRDHLWGKTKKALQYLYANHLRDYDWFLKADDDTYVVMENLRGLLKDYNSSDVSYFGCKFNKTLPYMSGGAGYVLSNGAVKRFAEEALKSSKCRQDNGGYEDMELSKCLDQVGVNLIDTLDEKGSQRFYPDSPEKFSYPLRNKTNIVWLDSYAVSKFKQGISSMSTTPISFHYIDDKMMYLLEYLFYTARVM